MTSPSPLPGFELQRDWAARKGVTKRTVERYRRAGQLAYMEWAGKVWIDVESGDELLRSRVKRRNPPRLPRAKTANIVHRPRQRESLTP